MTDLLIRGLIAAPLAVLVPFGDPRLNRRLVRIGLAGLLITAAVATHLEVWQSWVIIGCSLIVAAVIPGQWYREHPARPVLAVLGLAVVTIAITEPSTAVDSLAKIGESQDLVIVIGGGLLCTFVGGAVVGRVLHPLAQKMMQQPRGLEDAGRYIGWLERLLLYGVVVVGAPDAAALIIAAKSIARFPSFSEERFAEYYLIGSFLSLLIAFTCALAVRAATAHALLP